MRYALFATAFALIIVAAPPVRAIENGTEVSADSPAIHPGQYIWQPKASPTGPVIIVVDLPNAFLQVYRNGVPIGSSTISSGVKDHPTPTGIFTILQKRTTHHSNAYPEASMPYMERLTWDGLAIHAGGVPDHPESHGCVHVPLDFAKKLYGITHAGTTVLVADDSASVTPSIKPDLVFSRAKGPIPLPPPGTAAPYFSWKPKRAPEGGVCVVFSSVDSRFYVYRDGVEIGRATVQEKQPGLTVGDRVFTATDKKDAQGFPAWKQLGSVRGTPAPEVGNVLPQLVIPPAFLDHLRQAVTTGSTLVMTDQPVNKPREKPDAILDTADQ